MVEGRRKSRSLRRIRVTTPGARRITHYELRNPGKAQCGKCGRILHGMPNVPAQKLHKIAKTHKRPTRPYGGNLCTKCMRATITQRVIP
ncbi:50S ribosomal protein L34e [Candidatus Woesearchaeota archaeon]|nr:50S ribosomal protein L34e [Candidatus Woesearchaeota archaeon]